MPDFATTVRPLMAGQGDRPAACERIALTAPRLTWINAKLGPKRTMRLVMATISSIFNLAARGAVTLLLLSGWIATVAAGVCVADGVPGNSSVSGSLNQSIYSGNAGGIGQCCMVPLSYAEQAVPAKEASTFRSGPAALPPVATASSVEPAVSAPTVSMRTSDERPHPPFYLLYRRFLIPFSL